MTTATMDVAEQNAVAGDRLAVLEAKMDALAESVAALGAQVQLLTDKAYEDRRRQREFDELKTDLAPVMQDMYNITVQQLEEIQTYVQLEDVLYLLKRLARNTRTLNEMLGQVESMYDLWKDVSPLTKDMVAQAVYMLDELERKGYFGFLRQGQYVMDQVVTSFSEDDVRLLGDNVVLILNTVKALTQPEMMSLVNNLTQGFHEVEEHVDELPTSMLGILRQMRDPEVRRGMAMTMAMLKRVSQQSPAQAKSVNGHH